MSNEPSTSERTRLLRLTIFYALIILAAVLLYLRGGLAMHPFVYQGF